MAKKKSSEGSTSSSSSSGTRAGTQRESQGAFLNKLSTKTIIGKVEIPEGEEDIELYTIYGVARGIKTGEGDRGEWTAFLGQFHAVRIDNGKKFRSAKCFLPKSVTEMLADALQQARINDPKAEIRFAYMVGAHLDDTSATGYTYTCEPLIQEENDAMAQLEAQLTGKFKSLPAPSESAD